MAPRVLRGIVRRKLTKLLEFLLTNYMSYSQDYTPFIYTTESLPEKGFLVPYSAPGREIQGREAVAYLTFIVDYYESLPDYLVFIHANENQWHNDLFGGKTSKTLKNFRYQGADSQGYVNLRCSTDPGCPTSVNPRDPTLQDTRHKDVRLYLADIYMYLFQVPYESVPEHIGGVCCAQFVVTREQVLKRPKTDYERMLSWVSGTRTTDSFGVGWVMEKVWHVVFKMEPI